MKEKGNQYDLKRMKLGLTPCRDVAMSLYMKAFETKHPKTKEDYDTLIHYVSLILFSTLFSQLVSFLYLVFF